MGKVTFDKKEILRAVQTLPATNVGDNNKIKYKLRTTRIFQNFSLIDVYLRLEMKP